MLVFPRTERQAQIVELARRVGEPFVARAAAHDREGSFPAENFAELVAAGYHALPVPARFGGGGADLLEVVLGQYELGQADGSTALSMNMHLMTIGIAAEVMPWPAATFDRLSREVVEDGALLNSAAAEPELGSPASGGRPETVARPVPGGWRLSGRKTFVSAAPALTYFIVLATFDDDAAPPRVGNFLVRNGSPGLGIEATWDVLGMRATASHDLVLDGVFVPEADLLNQRTLGGGDARGGANTAWFALTTSAVYLGVARAAQRFAADWANARTPTALAQPISHLPAVQWKMADTEIALVTGRTLVFGAAADWVACPERRPELLPAIAAVKTVAVESALRVVDLTLRVAGGVGLYKRLPLERYFRDMRGALVHPPIEDRAREMIGRTVLGLNAPPVRGPSG